MPRKLNQSEKIRICKDIQSGHKDKMICEGFNISKGMLYRLKKKREGILAQGFSTSEGTIGYELNAQVYEIFRNLRSKGFPINWSTLKLIARKIAYRNSNHDFTASNGWLYRFKKQFEIKFRILHSESRSADKEGAENFRSTFNDLLENYGGENIFNCDETALFYKAVSKKSFVEKNESHSGHKIRKERMTLLLCCSYTGEKYKPLIIGRTKSLRVLKGVNLREIGIEYDASCKAWMTKNIFENWLSRFNEEMREKRRKIALLIDNATCNAVSLKLSNVDQVYQINIFGSLNYLKLAQKNLQACFSINL
ncbi:tigger transposable element-derived protein 4-like [Octopus sinensis]|uniref:Tigger transposable element-derived protein 4-like n=1 Tax=Octopus sinensis TaxID=2607531 RepID=A0A6P7U197_9MOLL|nr:tigger transposable element-derived protein 4-like [Octopus sinensis]